MGYKFWNKPTFFKVRKFQNQIFFVSFPRKTNDSFTDFCLMSGSKMGQIKKIKALHYIKYHLISIIICLYCFDSTHFRDLGRINFLGFSRGRSQTMSIRFWLFWQSTYLHWHFLPYECWQKVDIFGLLPPSSCKCNFWTTP